MKTKSNLVKRILTLLMIAMLFISVGFTNMTVTTVWAEEANINSTDSVDTTNNAIYYVVTTKEPNMRDNTTYTWEYYIRKDNSVLEDIVIKSAATGTVDSTLESFHQNYNPKNWIVGNTYTLPSSYTNNNNNSNNNTSGNSNYDYDLSINTDKTIGEISGMLKPQANLNDAAQTLMPVMGMVNTVIGILATVILIAVGFFTAVDVLYLEVPALHSSMDEKAMANGQESKKTGGVKPKLVSEDAAQAYSEATNEGAGKNPLIIYLKKRVIAYIAVAVVLYMLLSGNFAFIVNIVLRALSGVFGWFENYAQ